MVQTANRNAELKQILHEHRRTLQDEVQSRLRDGRTNNSTEVRDLGETSDDIHQRDIGFSLLQMRADLMTRVEEALARLDAGQYGDCADCNGEIAELRLRVLPFAVRCRACETKREQAKASLIGLKSSATFRPLNPPDVVSRAGLRSAASY